MSGEDHTAVHVNFGRPMAIFPLDSVTLLPQQVLPLHIFEPRYRQMVDVALDASGQIAMAVFEGQSWPSDYAGSPPVRPAVCIGQIVEHEKLPDGRYNIFLQGVCRARIVRELEPDTDRQFRAAVLEPLGLDDPDEDTLDRFRRSLESDLAEGELAALSAASTVLEYVQNEAVPSPALLELVAFALIQEPRARYRLLAEGDPDRRLELVAAELNRLRKLVRGARAQRPQDWPKGLSWN